MGIPAVICSGLCDDMDTYASGYPPPYFDNTAIERDEQEDLMRTTTLIPTMNSLHPLNVPYRLVRQAAHGQVRPLPLLGIQAQRFSPSVGNKKASIGWEALQSSLRARQF